MTLQRGTGCCTPQSPWSTKLAGPDPGSASLSGLAFTVANPCGATVAPVTFVQTPLQTIARWSGCVGDTSAPGNLVLVQGHVQAITEERNSTSPRPNLGSDCLPNSRTTEPHVKLAITSCGKPGPVIIDADSSIVVPAGPITIDVLAPIGWGEGIIPTSEGEGLPWTDVTLKVSACPCSCGYTPCGWLTAWGVDDIAALIGTRVLVRPRRARRLQMTGATAAGGTQNIGLIHSWDAAGTRLFGQTLFQGGFPLTLDVGGIPYVIPQSIALVSSFNMRWTIE